MSYIGEFCPKCNKARLLHPQAYVYTCPFCRFSYQVNPVSRFKDITILNKGRLSDKEVRKLSKAQHKRHDHKGEKRSIVKLEGERHDITILSKPNKQKQLKAKKERKAIDKANQQRWG